VEDELFGATPKRRPPKFFWSTVLRNGAREESRRASSRLRGSRSESYGGSEKGEPSESFNPRDGFGMKQGRADASGTRRHEVEKT